MRIAPHVHETPLLTSATLSRRHAAACGLDPAEVDVRLKAECLQKAGSFKMRGVMNFLRALTDIGQARGVVTYSSGNHAQAVAKGAAVFGLAATVVMPEDTPHSKIAACRAYGATVEFAGRTSDVRQARAEALAAEHDLAIVPPFEHEDIMAGQGTVGLEILREFPQVECLVVPIGGGGLIGGISRAARAIKPETHVVGVEPEGACAMKQSLDAGEIVRLDSIDTIADGLRPIAPGALTFEAAREYVHSVVTVTDDEIRAAMRVLFERAKLHVEPSGAATTAALLAGKLPTDIPRSKVALVVSGGNTDVDRFMELIGEAPPDSDA